MRTLVCIAALLVSACRPEPARHDDSTVVTPSSSPTPTTISAATVPDVPSTAAAASDPAAALARYLAFASFRGVPAEDEGQPSCPPFVASEGESDEGWEPDNYVGLVLPHVIDASVDKADTTGTSATGRAEVTRVAEIQRDSPGWLGTLERRLDTLTFTMERGPGGWAVCGPATKARNDSLPGEPLFVITYEDALRTEVNGARWLPTGTTWESVALHADSIRKTGR